MESELAIALNNVEKRYANFQLKNLDLHLPKGEVMGLVGMNGAGKSTTIRIIMGLIAADKGEVDVLGCRLPEHQVRAKSRMAFASEDMRLYKNQNLGWHMQLVAAFYPDWDQGYANTLLKKFRLNKDQKLAGFSHGQRVKAFLLLLLARRTQLLVLDEPTTGLDPIARSEIMDELADVLLDEERSILFSSHNTQEVERLSDTLTFLHEGIVVAASNTDTFLNGWRRILCRGSVNDWAAIPGITQRRESGSLTELKIEHYNDGVPGVLQEKGLEVLEVNRMDLEEIFVAHVKRENSL